MFAFITTNIFMAFGLIQVEELQKLRIFNKD